MVAIFMRYPEGRAKALTFSYDDGVPEDKRLAELLAKYGLKGTFNFCSDRKKRRFDPYTKEELEEYFFSNGHEIAVHGAFHRANGNIRIIEGIRDVLDCRLELEEKCDRIIRGMAYPDTGIRCMSSGLSYEQIKNYLSELDIVYARTLGGDNDDFELPSDFHAWMPTAHHDNPKIMEFIDKFLELDLSTNTYHARRGPRLFYIWGHSFEFEKKGNWNHIEEICKKFAGRDDIWYATNIEIYDYIEAYRRLVYSADGMKIYNPTLIDLWIDRGGEVYKIESGATLKL